MSRLRSPNHDRTRSVRVVAALEHQHLVEIVVVHEQAYPEQGFLSERRVQFLAGDGFKNGALQHRGQRLHQHPGLAGRTVAVDRRREHARVQVRRHRHIGVLEGFEAAVELVVNEAEPWRHKA